MEKLKKKQLTKIIALTVIFSFLTFNLFISNAEGKTCEEGLLACLVAAGFSFFGGIEAGLAMSAFCAVGYSWCKEFME